ncbi:MAG: hypothetical protein HZB34_02055 [Nitrospirae bacterium]|nr:hypothetical protein [Nitrospirota bacterium]
MLNDPPLISIPRHQLYEQVWSQPMTRLACQYGISDVALAKICRKLAIPYPGRGYWRRKQTGKIVKQLPLPPSADPTKQSATISKRSLAQSGDHLSIQAKEKIQSELTSEPRIEVPDRLVSPHRLLSGRLTPLRSPKVNNYGAVSSGGFRDLNLRVSPSSLPRALRIMNALFHALESRGYQLSLDGGAKSSLSVRIDGEPIHFGLEERFRREAHPDQHNDRLPAWQRQRYTYVATGKLLLKVTEWGAQGLRKVWTDCKAAKVEACLNEFIGGLLKVAHAVRAERLRREEEHRARVEAQRRQWAEEERRKKEEARKNYLMKEAEAWGQAQNVRTYVTAFREKFVARYGDIQAGSQADQWIRWACRQADSLDPLACIESPSSTA